MANIAYFFGKDVDDEIPPTAGDLISAVVGGDVNAVLDILDHDSSPVHPDAVGQDGYSATYAILSLLLYRDKVQPVHFDFGSEDGLAGLLNSMWTMMMPPEKETINIELVLQMLLYKGGDVNFVQRDTDGNGYGILHLAAEIGACDFMEWMIKVQHANESIQAYNSLRTPLMVAAAKDQVLFDVTHTLITLGGGGEFYLFICLFIC